MCKAELSRSTSLSLDKECKPLKRRLLSSAGFEALKMFHISISWLFDYDIYAVTVKGGSLV